MGIDLSKCITFRSIRNGKGLINCQTECLIYQKEKHMKRDRMLKGERVLNCMHDKGKEISGCC
jgi:hypothetical protein